MQDIRDDPARTDRWFVELNVQVRFRTEGEARAFLAGVDRSLTKK